MSDSAIFQKILQENEQLQSQNQQMAELALDFNAMVLNREESKKQLEAKFDDLSKKLQITKESLFADKKRIFYTLDAFRSKYTTEIDQQDLKYQTIINQKKQQTKQLYDDQTQQLQQLKTDIDKERNERIQFNIQNLKQVRQEVEKNLYKQEKNDRITSQKKIIRQLDDNNFNLTLKLNNQETARNLAVNEYRSNAQQAIANLSKNNEKFNTNVSEELKHLHNNINLEFSSRLSSQNKIIDNFSNLISTLQDTLKLFSG